MFILDILMLDTLICANGMQVWEILWDSLSRMVIHSSKWMMSGSGMRIEQHQLWFKVTLDMKRMSINYLKMLWPRIIIRLKNRILNLSLYAVSIPLFHLMLQLMSLSFYTSSNWLFFVFDILWHYWHLKSCYQYLIPISLC